MSLQTRKEILSKVQKRYKGANWNDKRKILDEYVATTGYRRKYAISLLNCTKKESKVCKNENKDRKPKYDSEIRQALLTIWNASNRICSKRLVPFIPELIIALERFGHLLLPINVRNRLLEISPATVDRLLKTERQASQKGTATTRPGSLLKKQIKIRTFSDWSTAIPGFMEGDLVAHCGDRTDGPFLNTLVLTDIATSWTEFFPLLKKGEADVISALQVAKQLLPFLLLGLDTDNGSEFINYALLNFCKTEAITFTRSRAYKKNDQAHVEEKNGSIIRRLIGYDRYEGIDSYNALSELYAVLRLCINFFQPSLKLISKKREGAKITKKYDKAKTPYQRLLSSSDVCKETKEKLKKQYDDLDPVRLLKNLEKLQDNFWKHAWKPAMQNSISTILDEEANNFKYNDIRKEIIRNVESVNSQDNENNAVNSSYTSNVKVPEIESKPQLNIRRYRRMKKPGKRLAPRTWRTRPDPFSNAWSKINMKLKLNPERTAKSLLEDLIKEDAAQFNINQLRTLQRRVANWRLEQIKIKQERHFQHISTKSDIVSKYVSLLVCSVKNK